MSQTIRCDVVVIGGGIAGLLSFRRLKNLGLSVILLEKNALGAGQTLASQGIIHGGSKYALQGVLNSAATEVAQMTSIWAKYLRGETVDLSRVKILSSHHYLWASGFGASLKTLISSKILSSDNRVLARKQYPSFFQDPNFSGSLCELDEVVLDIPSLLRALVAEDQDDCLKISNDLKVHWDVHQSIEKVSDGLLEVKAKYYVFTAGEGNLNYFQGLKLQMQTRPLKMLMLKHPDLWPIYVHYVGKGVLPELTITSHQTSRGAWIWYLGGAIAEAGVHRSDAEQIKAAEALLEDHFAWRSQKIDFTRADYHCWDIARAEIFNQGKRPESFGLFSQGNFFVGWPTKLTLAPALVEAILQKMHFESLQTLEGKDLLKFFQKADFAKTPWEEQFVGEA